MSSTPEHSDTTELRVLMVIPALGEHDERTALAADAVREALVALKPSCSVRIARLSELIPAAARGVVAKARQALSRVIPQLGAEPTEGDGDGAGPTGGLGEIADVALALHPLGAATLSEMRRLGFAPVPLLGAVLAPGSMEAWAKADLDRYLVGNEIAARGLAAQGVAQARIAVSGVPLQARWHVAVKARDALRARHGIATERRVVIVDVAGLDADDLAAILLQLGLMQDRCDVLYATSSDTKVADYLRQQAARLGVRARMFGDVERAEEIWALGDLVVAHAAHADLSRSAALGAPLLLLGELPSGGDREALLATIEQGSIRLIPSPLTVGAEVDVMLRGERLARMKQALGPLAPEGAAKTVAEAIVLAHQNRGALLEEAQRRSEAPRPVAPAPEPVGSAPVAAEPAASTAPAAPPSPLEDIGAPVAAPPPAPSSAPAASSPLDSLAPPPRAAPPINAAPPPPAGPAALGRASDRVRVASEAADEVRRELDLWERRAHLAAESHDHDLIRVASLKADKAREQLSRALRELHTAEDELAAMQANASLLAPTDDPEIERRFQRLTVDRELEALKKRLRESEG